MIAEGLPTEAGRARSETFAHHKCINERGRAVWKEGSRPIALAVAGEPPNAVGLLRDYGAEGSRPIVLAVIGEPPNAVGLLRDYEAEGSRPIVLAVAGEPPNAVGLLPNYKAR